MSTPDLYQVIVAGRKWIWRHTGGVLTCGVCVCDVISSHARYLADSHVRKKFS